MLPDEDVDAAANVLPMKSLSVVTQPGAVKILHRSGRVVWTFTGPTWREDALELATDLVGLLGDEPRIKREVLLVKPWWRRLWRR